MSFSFSQPKGYSVYLFEYFHEGSWWMLEIPATSPEDAEARLNKLPQAQYLGEGVMRIPAKAGFFAPALCWVRNLLRCGSGG